MPPKGSKRRRAGIPAPAPTTFYAVAKGRQPGVYRDWSAVQQQVRGFPGAKHKKFSSYGEAERFVRTGGPKRPVVARVQQPPPEPERPAHPADEPARWFVLRAGGKPGLYDSWAAFCDATEDATGCRFRLFEDKAEAQKYLREPPSQYFAVKGARREGVFENLREAAGIVVRAQEKGEPASLSAFWLRASAVAFLADSPVDGPKEEAAAQAARAVGGTAAQVDSALKRARRSAGLEPSAKRAKAADAIELDDPAPSRKRARPSVADVDMEILDEEEGDSVELIPSDSIDALLQFDGGSRGNPGVAGSGWVLYSLSAAGGDKTLLRCGWVYEGARKTNNEAEYGGLIAGLEAAAQLPTLVRSLRIEGDSQLVQKQVQGLYKVNKPHLRKLVDKVKALLKRSFPAATLHHIYREQNSVADALANRAMDTRSSGDAGAFS